MTIINIPQGLFASDYHKITSQGKKGVVSQQYSDNLVQIRITFSNVVLFLCTAWVQPVLDATADRQKQTCGDIRVCVDQKASPWWTPQSSQVNVQYFGLNLSLLYKSADLET